MGSDILHQVCVIYHAKLILLLLLEDIVKMRDQGRRRRSQLAGVGMHG